MPIDSWDSKKLQGGFFFKLKWILRRLYGFNKKKYHATAICTPSFTQVYYHFCQSDVGKAFVVKYDMSIGMEFEQISQIFKKLIDIEKKYANIHRDLRLS